MLLVSKGKTKKLKRIFLGELKCKFITKIKNFFDV